MNSVITHTATPNLAGINSILNRLPSLETFLGPRQGTVNEIQIDVAVAPFSERGIDCRLCSFVPVVWIPQFSRKEDLLLAHEQERGRYILTFTAGFLHPGRHGAADVCFVAVPCSTIDVAVSRIQGRQYCIVAFLAVRLVNAQREHWDRVPRVQLLLDTLSAARDLDG